MDGDTMMHGGSLSRTRSLDDVIHDQRKHSRGFSLRTNRCNRIKKKYILYLRHSQLREKSTHIVSTPQWNSAPMIVSMIIVVFVFVGRHVRGKPLQKLLC
jgi:hypothetical protein